MSTERKDGGPAFPIYTPDMNVGNDAGPGMSMRDWYAGQALVGLASNTSYLTNAVRTARDSTFATTVPQLIARAVYEIADAMLKAREERS